MNPAESSDYLSRKGQYERWVVYMRHALKIACSSPQKPFGAILVHTVTGEIISEGFNSTDEDPILHAEIAAIHNCARRTAKLPWQELELYTTAEPCAMCQCAIEFARIPFVCYGTSSSWLQQHGWRQIGIQAEEVIRRTSWSKTVIVGGILADECNALLEAARSQCKPSISTISPYADA